MKNLSEIYRPIQSELKASEALLVKELTLRESLLGTLTRYVSRMPGKRIRPALAILGARLASPPARLERLPGRANGSVGTKAVQLATAVEMIHTATLLHDDVIDGASLRRGLLTLNAKWGDTLSVLSGDYLYSKAFCLLSELKHQAVLSLLSETARLVCEGEVAQIQHRRDLALSTPKYLKIIQWKTASLMGACVQAGALLGGASPAQAKRLGEFGLNFGLAFQILDDTQDLVGDEAALGKSLGTDVGQGHLTLPLIYLREVATPETRARVDHYFNGNGHSPSDSELDSEALQFLKDQALRFQVPEHCRQVAGRYLSSARETLAPFAPSPYKESLLALTRFLL